MSVLVAEHRAAVAGPEALSITPGLTEPGCFEEAVAFAGRPGGLAVDAAVDADADADADGAVFVSLPASGTIWHLLESQWVPSVSSWGNGEASSGADQAMLTPAGMAIGPEGTCCVADTGNNAVRSITPAGEVTTVIGSPPGGGADGVGVEVGLRWPTGIAIGNDGRLWVADHANGSIPRIGGTGKCTTTFRLDGRRWPVAVALAPGDEVMVAVEVVDEERRHLTCLIATGAER